MYFTLILVASVVCAYLGWVFLSWRASKRQEEEQRQAEFMRREREEDRREEERERRAHEMDLEAAKRRRMTPFRVAPVASPVAANNDYSPPAIDFTPSHAPAHTDTSSYHGGGGHSGGGGASGSYDHSSSHSYDSGSHSYDSGSSHDGGGGWSGD